MRRRLDIAASLVVTPELMFLDEPTTGLDPRSRNQVWAIIRALAGAGTTVLLCTQYLDEADQLADGIAVIDQGKVIAEGTPAQLKASVGSGALHIRLLDPDQRPVAEPIVARFSTPRSTSSPTPRRCQRHARAPTWRRRSSASSRGWASPWRTSPSASPAWTRSSWRSPAIPPRSNTTENEQDRDRTSRAGAHAERSRIPWARDGHGRRSCRSRISKRRSPPRIRRGRTPSRRPSRSGGAGC